MEKFIDLLSKEVADAFEKAGYDANLGKVNVSNRPDLAEYQCNGAMAAAKVYHKAPIMVANDVVEVLKNSSVFAKVEAVNPGFINLDVSPSALKDYILRIAADEKFGLDAHDGSKTVIIDYGGPNVAKPLHVGHLRSAVIGESIKRIYRYMGDKVIGDIHLGDWGLQMGLIIAELRERQPELVYFDESFEGEYPSEAPFTISDLEEIYPFASGKSKQDEAFKAKAMEATFKLQSGVRGYRALWNHIINVSVADLKRNYNNLNVEFDLWNGESTVHEVIPGMVSYLKDNGYAHLDQGALVVDVKEETDTKEIPPCMILKSDGASLYNTTDLATIMERMRLYNPAEIIYVVDKRQDLYFEQVFRCARKTKLVNENTSLKFLGFGTVNGKDGHAFKTRDGGVLRLEYLINEINDKMLEKILSGREMSKEEAEAISKVVALSALKYGDLSNQASKNYIFDIDKFISFEGDTGPYLLYTVVRIKSILAKAKEEGLEADTKNIIEPTDASSKNLLKTLLTFNSVVENAYDELAPHKICAYLYDMANAFNSFYHENNIMKQEDPAIKASFLGMLKLTLEMANASMDMLGFSAPEKM
ncbi:MAG: arginine--tRNA ligase [Lachnospiraceae bacterium]|nr:arginine--tRNA ligase [Lachnospiraceae bacterium]